MIALPEAPPLALYIHIPWCLQKCPYCDFNSHAVISALDEMGYVDALLSDLDLTRGRSPFGAEAIQGREHIATKMTPTPSEWNLASVFIGGGTPSLFSGAAIARLLDGVRDRCSLAPDIEISIEANPGAADRQQFRAYRQAGVNRISIGAQSFASEQLQVLGRIHGPGDAVQAVNGARSAGFKNLNLDIMYGLPGQSLESALDDVKKAISLEPQHISYYQLTIEPNTRFYTAPPVIPDDDLLVDIENKGRELLEKAGYNQYEVSAFAQNGFECRHNRNYWEFGDYLGIGAGAHGKLSDPANGQIFRTRKTKSPDRYLHSTESRHSKIELVEEKNLALEFMLNALRLRQGFHPGLLQQRTGLKLSMIEPALERAKEKGLLEVSDDLICPTSKGMKFLNELVAMFMS